MSILDHMNALMAAGLEDSLSYGEERLRAEYLETAGEKIQKKRFKDAWVKALIVERNGDGVTVRMADRQQGDSQTALALIAEQGLPKGFDLKPFLLKGKPFVDVPFDKTVGMVEHYVAAIQAGAGQAKAKKALAALKPWVYVADSQGNATLVGRGTYQPKTNLVPKIKPYHVADPLHRITRQAAAYSQKEGEPAVVQTTGYRFFRRVSLKSAPESWTYRDGVPGANVFETRQKEGRDEVVGKQMAQRRYGPVLEFQEQMIESLQAWLDGGA